MTKLLFAASLTSLFFGWFGVSWDEVDSKIAAEYPTVPYITATELLDSMQDDNGISALLFDVREAEEFAVSHLVSASNLSTSTAIAAVVNDRNAPIIVYCSVGYRSAGIAAQLQQLGYTNVRNLQHSLFEWANNGYPMVNASGTTDRVHPYNRAWGQLVAEPLRSYAP